MIDGENEWDVEVTFYVNKCGIDREKAHAFVIMRWMYHGDFRPLAAAIWEGGEGVIILDAVLIMLARLIDEGRVTLLAKKRGRTGRPRDMAKDIRRIVAAMFYETNKAAKKSDERIEEIGKFLGMSHQSVRNAITAWKKRKRPKPSKVSGPE